MASNQSTRSPQSEAAALSNDKGAAGLGEIVVFIDGRAETAGILEFAGVLAQEHGARLTAVFMQPEPAVTPPETFARGKGMQSVIEAHRAQLEGIEADHRARFENIVRRHDPVGVEIVALPGQRGGRACVLRGPGGYCPPGICGPDGRPSWPRGVPRLELRPADHHFSTARHGISCPPHPCGVERQARSHPRRGRRPAVACEGQGSRDLGGRP